MIGQFFTPEPIVHLMYRIAKTRPGQRIMDPSCGDGAFVRAAPAGCKMFGCELDPRFHAALKELFSPRRFIPGDALTKLRHLHSSFDLVIGNPPFSAQSHLERRPEALRQFDLGVGRRSQCLEVLFLELFYRLAKPGGRVAIILPDGPLANHPFHYVRRWLLDRARIETIVSLPRGVFPRTAAKTNILIARKYKDDTTTECTKCTEGRTSTAPRMTQMAVVVRSCISCIPWCPVVLSPDADWRPEAPSTTAPVSRASVRLGDLFHLRTGFARYAKQRELFDRPAPGRVLLIRAKNFSPAGGLRLGASLAFIRKGGPMFREAALVQPGELIFVRVGAGCYGRAAVVPRGLAAQADDWIHILTPKRGVDARAVVDWMNSAGGRAAVRRLAKGVGTLSISKFALAGLRIPATIAAASDACAARSRATGPTPASRRQPARNAPAGQAP